MVRRRSAGGRQLLQLRRGATRTGIAGSPDFTVGSRPLEPIRHPLVAALKSGQKFVDAVVYEVVRRWGRKNIVRGVFLVFTGVVVLEPDVVFDVGFFA